MKQQKEISFTIHLLSNYILQIQDLLNDMPEQTHDPKNIITLLQQMRKQLDITINDLTK